MPSKKKSQVEVIAPDPLAKPTRRAVVAAKHTVTYEAPEVVEIPAEDDEENDEDEYLEPEQPQIKQPTFRVKLRKRFEARGIGNDETLTLRIDRLPFFEQNGLAGVRTDKEFCGVIPCTEKFFEGDEYLVEIQRRYGPGEYWLTVRHKNAIVSSWRERCGGFPVAPIAVQSSEPGQPPQVIYQQPGQFPAPRNLKEELREVSEMIRLVDDIRGPREDVAANPARSEDEILATAILKQPDMVESVVGSLVKRFGRSGGGDDDPTPWSVAMKLVETGQAAQIVKAIFDSFFNGVNSMIPGRQNNGQAQMAEAPHANMGAIQNPPPVNGQTDQFRQNQNIQALPQGVESPSQVGAPGASGQQQSPEQDALALVLHHCKHKIPPKITYAELAQREQRLDLILNQHGMQTGQILSNQISLYVDMLGDMSAQDAIGFVKTLPGGEEVAALPHAKEWTEALQAIIKENQEGDDA